MELCTLIENEAPTFDFMNTAHAFNLLAKTQRLEAAARRGGSGVSDATAAATNQALGRALESLASLLPRTLPDFVSWDTSNCLWALASLPSEHIRACMHVFEALCRRGRQLAMSMNQADCAMYMIAFGRLGIYDVELLHAIPQVLLQELDQTEPQNVRAVLWGFARLALQHPGAQRPSTMFMEAVCENLLWTINQYDYQELTNCLWAIASLGHHPSRGLLRAAEGKLLEAPHLLAPGDVAQALWAFGRLRYVPLHLLDALPAARLSGRLHEFSPEEMSCVLFGYAQARHHAPQLLDAVAPLLMARAGAGAMSEQDLVIALWCYGVFGHSPAAAAVARVAPAVLRTAQQQRVGSDGSDGSDSRAGSQGAGGHGEGGASSSGEGPSPSGDGEEAAAALHAFVDALLAPLTRPGVVARLRPVGLANMLKALASLRVHGARVQVLVAAVSAATEKQVEDFRHQEMSNILYGLSIMRSTDLAPYYAVVRELLKRMEASRRVDTDGDGDGDDDGNGNGDGSHSGSGSAAQQQQHRGEPLLPTQQLINSVVHSCVSAGYTPWTLIESAEMRGIRVRNDPGSLKPRWWQHAVRQEQERGRSSSAGGADGAAGPSAPPDAERVHAAAAAAGDAGAAPSGREAEGPARRSRGAAGGARDLPVDRGSPPGGASSPPGANGSVPRPHSHAESSPQTAPFRVPPGLLPHRAPPPADADGSAGGSSRDGHEGPAGSSTRHPTRQASEHHHLEVAPLRPPHARLETPQAAAAAAAQQQAASEAALADAEVPAA
ncbi:hypothetical protein FOA52_010726 [Chlamydomonas sp. UWO 241]|nr:hypothetical protein FOA52_010726 [Chlamydomonas sp. UWO 241]